MDLVSWKCSCNSPMGKDLAIGLGERSPVGSTCKAATGAAGRGRQQADAVDRKQMWLSFYSKVSRRAQTKI